VARGRQRGGAALTPSRALPLVLVLSLWLGCGAKAPPRPLRPEAARPAVSAPGAPAPRSAALVAPRLQVHGRDGALALSWRLAGHQAASRFPIERRTAEDAATGSAGFSGFKVVQVVDLAAPAGARISREAVEVLDFDLAPGERFEYRVVALDERGRPGPASTPVRVDWRGPPPPPRRIEARPGDRVVELRWEASPDPAVTRYNVYRAVAASEFAERPLNSRPLESTDLVDLGPANNQEYRYLVRALAPAGELLLEGPPSPEVSAVPRDLEPPVPPSRLQAQLTRDGIQLRWQPVKARDLKGYRVYRRGPGASEYLCLTPEPLRKPQFFDRTADPKGTWSYGVTAVDTAPSANESGHAAEATLGAKDDGAQDDD